MEFHFLEAAGTPLTKTFHLADGKVATTPYPYVKYVTTHLEQADDLTELLPLLERHGMAGHCLLKSTLKAELNGESRAGMCDPEKHTSWMLLDLDFEEGWPSVDAFIAELNPEWANVSYIFQHSASAGVKYKAGLRGHLFILLDEPIAPGVLKDWLKERNLNLAKLRANASLSANGMAIKWPLDISTCQSDKLIYIAPPVCKDGIKDPLAGDRFQHCPRTVERAKPPQTTASPATLNQQTHELINQLRTAADLPKRKPKYRDHGQYDVLENPEVATVTGAQQIGNFMRLNLNGGDSWGYYFPLENPTLLFNFKDEPIVRLKDIAPDFYRTYRQRARQEARGSLDPYVFRDPITDSYYNALYNTQSNAIEMLSQCSTKDRLNDFMLQHGEILPEPVPDWTLEFDPTRLEVIDIENQWMNRYTPSKYIRAAPNLTPYPNVPPQIDRLLNNLCGEDEIKEHFLNWLAFVFQTRERPQTAWVFHGGTSTGKGTLLERVLRPLFHRDHCLEYTMQNFEEHFNAKLEHTSILWFDECQLTKCRNPEATMAKLKSFITEPEIAIRGMRQNTRMVKNYLAIILTSNFVDPIHLADNDRRFNVAPAQHNKIEYPPGFDFEGIFDDEVACFASYLWNYKVDANRVTKVLYNQARQNMITASAQTHDLFFTKLRQGDLDFFLDFLEAPGSEMTLQYTTFEQTMTKWCQALKDETFGAGNLRMSRLDIGNVYHYVLGHSLSKIKLSKAASLNHCPIRQMRIDGQNVQGYETTVKTDMERIEAVLNNKPAGPSGARLTSIPGGKT